MADSRKASTAPGSDDENTIKVAPKKDGKDGKLKLKRPKHKINNPGNWRDGSIADDDKQSKRGSPSTNSVASPGPVVNQLDDNARDTFATGRPLEDTLDTVQCKHCKKMITTSGIKSHLETCLAQRKEQLRQKKEAKENKKVKPEKSKENLKSEAKEKTKETPNKNKDKAKAKLDKPVVDQDGDSKMGDDDDEEEDDTPDIPLKKLPGGIKSAKKSAGKKTDTADNDKKGKKRKADDTEKGPKQKKKKDEPKAKAPKPKGPVDVERQCGVINPDTGIPCARSLTCKSHSMGAKRAVAGRSLPYDMLLAAYQKKNQAKQQKAAIDANAPLEDEDEANAGPVDSDEETAAVMTALSTWKPQPLVPQPVLMPIKKRYQLERLRQQLHDATDGGRINIFKVVSAGNSYANGGQYDEEEVDDAPGEPDALNGVNDGHGARSRPAARMPEDMKHPFTSRFKHAAEEDDDDED